jgi:hypothetical protein
VAIRTTVEFNVEESVFAFRHVALSALQPPVGALQWISGGGMLFHGEGGWLPSLHRMARCALSGIGALGELAIMRIWFVAVHAPGKCDGPFKIAIRVALCTADGSMPSLQRELGLRMVEALVNGLERDLLPSHGAMATLAPLRKATVMRILVAVKTLVERNTAVLRFSIRRGDVALAALHLGMQSGQRVAGARMIELAYVDRLPIGEVVARETILS